MKANRLLLLHVRSVVAAVVLVDVVVRRSPHLQSLKVPLARPCALVEGRCHVGMAGRAIATIWHRRKAGEGQHGEVSLLQIYRSTVPVFDYKRDRVDTRKGLGAGSNKQQQEQERAADL